MTTTPPRSTPTTSIPIGEELMASQLPKFFPAVDGLRAIAIIGVMLYHLGIPGCELGWAGVDLFFVLSGFLITGILLDSKGHEHYFRNFYIRRSLRIFPIYYITLICIVLVGFALHWKLGGSLYFFTYLQNYPLGLNNWNADFPLLYKHTWSLAIEEQFYLLWPLLVYFLSPRQLRFAIISLILGAFLIRGFVLILTHNETLIYTSLPTRADALAAGALLALAVRWKGIAPRQILNAVYWLLPVTGFFALTLILCTDLPHAGVGIVRLYPINIVFYSLLSIFFAALLALVVLKQNRLSAALSTRFLRHIGKISYGLYLYHFIIFWLINRVVERFIPQYDALASDLVTATAKILITYLLALLSWNLIEKPLNSLKDHFPY